MESKKEELLNSSGASFMKAFELHQPDLCEIDERWLYHYMLGKVAEKRQKEPTEYLQHYLTVTFKVCKFLKYVKFIFSGCIFIKWKQSYISRENILQ